MSKTKNWVYSPAPESIDHIQLKNRYDLFINGEFIPPVDGKYFDTINPSNEEKIAEVAESSQADIEKAVESARKAYTKIWSKMAPKERGKYISGLLDYFKKGHGNFR